MSNESVNPYNLLSNRNKEWINSFIISDTIILSSKGLHICDFLVNLCRFLFQDYEPFVETDDHKTKKRQRSLTYVRSLFEFYKIKQPEHWSPMIKFEDVEGGDEDGVDSFNQAVDGIREYLDPSDDFLNDLYNNLKIRSDVCFRITRDIKDVADEVEFYAAKIDKINKLILTAPSNPEVENILKIVKSGERF